MLLQYKYSARKQLKKTSKINFSAHLYRRNRVKRRVTGSAALIVLYVSHCMIYTSFYADFGASVMAELVGVSEEIKIEGYLRKLGMYVVSTE